MHSWLASGKIQKIKNEAAKMFLPKIELQGIVGDIKKYKNIFYI